VEFNKAVQRIKKNIYYKLPAAKAHAELMPTGRHLFDLKQKVLKQTAVCILLFPKDNLTFSVLIERTTYNGVHSGQIGLPGGKKEKNDKNLTETGLRETEEEIGVNKKDIKVIGSISELYIPPSQFLVFPIIAYMEYSPEFVIDKNEVKSLITYDIDVFLNGFELKTKEFSGHNYTIEAPYFDINGYSVWGATAMILNEFRMLLKM